MEHTLFAGVRMHFSAWKFYTGMGSEGVNPTSDMKMQTGWYLQRCERVQNSESLPLSSALLLYFYWEVSKD